VQVLASTTRQWNPGDEFILWGTKKLMGLDFVSVYDRNPDIIAKSRVLSNSWKGEDLSIFDYILIAGSPEWGGKNLQTLYYYVERHKKPIYFIGIGGPAKNLSAVDFKVLKRAEIIIARDNLAKKNVEERVKRDVTLLPCPSLFCVDAAEERMAIKKIGFTIQVNDTLQKIDEEVFSQSLILLEKLKEKYEVSIICHYFKELYSLKLRQVGCPILYSYRAEDYPEIYKKFDFIFSTRLHGCFLAAALEIPSVLMNRSPRCAEAIKLVPFIDCLEPSEKLLETWDMEDWYKKIKSFKSQTLHEYQELLSKYIK